MLDISRLRVLVAVARHGSVTEAAKALHYAQPSVSHHLARLEAETGAVLVRRVGRGIRITDAGWVLVERAEEILGRIDAAETEIAEHVGLRQGRVRLAAFPSALGTFVPAAAARFRAAYPEVELSFVEGEPPEALDMLRAGEVEVAVTFHYDADAAEAGGVRTVALLEEPLYVVSPAGQRWDQQWLGPRGELATYARERWIAGCERCRGHLTRQCADAGFEPRIAFTTDDYVAVQSLVAAGLGVTTLPGLPLTAARHPDVRTDRVPGAARYVQAATYGDPPDPPATAALLTALARAAHTAAGLGSSGRAARPTGTAGS